MHREDTSPTFFATTSRKPPYSKGVTRTAATARNQKKTEQGSASALCRELTTGSGDAPEWIQLMPIGPAVAGRDGRAWKMSDPNAVVAATELPMVLDWEHATEIKAPNGHESPAAGWITDLVVVDANGLTADVDVPELWVGRDPGIWGRVAWNERGGKSVASREYRYLSPVFSFAKGSTEVLRLLNAALTNRPNLDLTALNGRESRQQEPLSEELPAMNQEQMKALCAALGLPADSSAEAITEAARNAATRASTLTTEVTALNARVSTLVTRDDLETALNRAKAAETQLATIAGEQHTGRVEAALNAAQSAGKISPASRVHYVAMCSDAAGLERFNALVETLPALCQDAATRQAPATPAANMLTKEDRDAIKALNCTEADYLANKTNDQEQV